MNNGSLPNKKGNVIEDDIGGHLLTRVLPEKGQLLTNFLAVVSCTKLRWLQQIPS
jgi:hypothetical protein